MTALATLALLPALFAPHPGWHVGNQTARACPSVSASRCAQAASWAATIPWRGCGFCIPHQTLAALRRQTERSSKSQVATERPSVAAAGIWPPTIRFRDVGGLEGVPRRNGVYQRFARYGRVEAYVFAFFGRAHPTASQFAAANAELATVRLHQ